MDKEDVAHIYNEILAIKRNETELFVVRWMDLETVIQSEVSQKKILYANTYMWNRNKNLKNGCAGPRGRRGIKTQM